MHDGPIGFPERLTAYRRLRGMSVAQLARALHTTPSAVLHWESGRNWPGYWTLIELSRALHVSLDNLVDVHFEKEKQHVRSYQA